MYLGPRHVFLLRYGFIIITVKWASQLACTFIPSWSFTACCLLETGMEGCGTVPCISFQEEHGGGRTGKGNSMSWLALEQCRRSTHMCCGPAYGAVLSGCSSTCHSTPGYSFNTLVENHWSSPTLSQLSETDHKRSHILPSAIYAPFFVSPVPPLIRCFRGEIPYGK